MKKSPRPNWARPSTCSALQQQLAIDQTLQSRLAQQFFVQQRSIEILAQLLHQLATLHVDGLAQFGLGDLFTVDLATSCLLLVEAWKMA